METLFNALEILLLVGSLTFVGRQVRLQSKVHSFQLYHMLVQQYAELLHRADTEPELNAIWEAPDPERIAELDAYQQAEDWGAWYAMNQVERRCYRYTRYAIELFEQAYLARQQGWIDAETWRKWQNWMAIWRDTLYFRYVFSDTKPRLVRPFVADFDTIATIPRPRIKSGRERSEQDSENREQESSLDNA